MKYVFFSSSSFSSCRSRTHFVTNIFFFTLHFLFHVRNANNVRRSAGHDIAMNALQPCFQSGAPCNVCVCVESPPTEWRQSLCCSHPARHILIIFKFVNPAVQIAAEKSLMRVRKGGSLFFFDCCHASSCGHQSESHLLFNYVKTISFPIHFRSNRIYVAYRTPFVRRSI